MKLKKILATLVTTLICLPFIGCPLQAQVGNHDWAKAGFTDNGDGTMNDGATRLQWGIKPSSAPMLAQDASKYCQKLRYAGHSDWRVPTEAELRNVVSNPLNCCGQSYWSYETSVSYNSHLAWYKRPIAQLLAFDPDIMRYVWPVREITSQELAEKKQELKEEHMRKLVQDTTALTQIYGKEAVEAFKSTMPNHDEIWLCVLSFAPDMANQLQEKGLVTATGRDVFLKLQRDVELKSWLKNAVIVDGRTDEKSRCPNRLELVLSSTPGGPQEAAAIFFLEGNRIKFHDIWIEKGVLGRAEGGFVH